MRISLQGIHVEVPDGWTGLIRHFLSEEGADGHVMIEEARVEVPDLDKHPPPEELAPGRDHPPATPPMDLLRAMIMAQGFALDDAVTVKKEELKGNLKAEADDHKGKIVSSPKALGYRMKYSLGSKSRPLVTEATTVVSGPRLIRFVARGKDQQALSASAKRADRMFQGMSLKKVPPPPPQALDEDEQYDRQRRLGHLLNKLEEPTESTVHFGPGEGALLVEEELEEYDRASEELGLIGDLEIDDEGRFLSPDGRRWDRLEHFLELSQRGTTGAAEDEEADKPADEAAGWEEEAPAGEAEEKGQTQKRLDRFLRKTWSK